MDKKTFKLVEASIGYRFRKRIRLQAALTHPSYRHEREDVDTDNQRLEFLGDAALGLVAAAHFYKAHPEFQEGELTKFRSRVSSRQALARVADSIHLGDYLLLGKGEKKSGGDVRPSNLADALEAILGAAYIDGQLKAVTRIFDKIFTPLLEEVSATAPSDNPKGELQEHCQEQWKTSPRYRLVREDGPAHARYFTVEVCVNESPIAEGTGRNKRGAEMEAAQRALQALSGAESIPGGDGNLQRPM